LISFLVMFTFRSIANGFVRFLVNFLGLTLAYGIVFGLVATYLRGSIGKKIMDLKVMPTVGMMTPIRLLIRDVGLKYLVTLPLIIGLISYINIEDPNFNTGSTRSSGNPALITGLLITLILWLGLAAANGYFFAKEKRWLVDVVLHTNVENDIPTAVEYQDLRSFLEKNEG